MRNQFVCQQQFLGSSIARKFLNDVQFSWINRDREVGRQRPRRCRPDRDARLIFPVAARDRKFHIHSRVVAVLIFDLRFGERSLGAGAPKNRLLRLVNQSFLNEDRECAQDFRFVFWIERKIRMFPIAEDTEPFELLALKIDILARERIATFANFQRRQIARLFNDFVFDRQSVTVPARNVGRTFAEHGLRFHDKIFQDFVERGAHVDVAVGERRAIVKHEQLLVFARLLDLLIKLRFIPHLEQLLLARRQIRLHWKIRARQIERVFVIFWGHRGRASLPSIRAPTNQCAGLSQKMR